MSIFQLYLRHGNRGGFWIQHRSWGNKCAHVLGMSNDAADPRSRLPQQEDPSRAFDLQLFDVRSGRIIPAGTSIKTPDDDRGYREIAEPPWHRD